MMGEKVIKMLSQLVMMILMARILGPEELGSLMYCFTIASAFIFLNTLGLDSLLVKVFVERANKQYSFLKHALVLRTIGAICSIVLINIVGYWLVSGDAHLLLFAISLYHLFMPFNVYEWFYQAQGRGDLSAYGLIVGHLSGFVFRLVCLFYGGDLIWLGIAYIVEMAAMACCYLFIAKGIAKNTHQTSQITNFSFERMINLLKDASPLILSGALVLLYMKVDQLMLGYMVNEAEVGIYVAATRLSEAWYFVGLTLIGVYFPKLIETKCSFGNAAYTIELIKKGRWLIWSGIALVFLTSFATKWLIDILYGPEYLESSNVLLLTIWTVPFVYLGAISNRMLILDSKTLIVLYRSFAGLLINLILNYFLIPLYGSVGAAIATLCSHIFVSYFSTYFFGEKTIFKIQTKILSLVTSYKVGK